MLTVRLKPNLLQRLEQLARRTGRSKSFYVARAIEDQLPHFEESYAPLPTLAPKDPAKVKQAIQSLKTLRQGVTKPDSMTVREMRDEGRA